jgi:hypothetical protein
MRRLEAIDPDRVDATARELIKRRRTHGAKTYDGNLRPFQRPVPFICTKLRPVSKTITAQRGGQSKGDILSGSTKNHSLH